MSKIKSEVVFAVYQPNPGKSAELEALIKKHVPLLREFGLATARQPIIVKSKNGTYIEIFEWESKEAVERAHHHPGVATIWEAMGKISTFGKLSALEEAGAPFVHFEPVN